MKSDELLERVLDQNDKLIAALAASSPVEVIKALNPPMVPSAPGVPVDPLAEDPEPVVPDDPWGDESVPLELLKGPMSTWRSGWVAAPGSESEDLEESPEVEDLLEELGGGLG